MKPNITAKEHEALSTAAEAFINADDKRLGELLKNGAFSELECTRQ